MTGADGFIGSYLMEYFVSKETNVFGTLYMPTIDINDIAHLRNKLLRCDIRYIDEVLDILAKTRPDVIFHMAAQSYPALSWKIPIETLHTSIIGTADLFEAIKALQLDLVVVACSSAEYGVTKEAFMPVTEDYPLQPLHPYGVSKVAVDFLAYQYWINDKIKVIRARIFNTTGPRKVGDVCSDFTYRMAAIEKGRIEPVLKVGNLDSYRAFLDVRDLVQALVLLSEKGNFGDVYNISGGKLHQVREILNIVQKHGKCEVVVQQDPSLLRSCDEKVIWGDSSKLISQTGWQQQITIEDTIGDMLEYWRRKL